MAGDSNAPGTRVARTARVARRVTALLAMVALIGLLLVLIWRVYLHHQHAIPSDEPAVAELERISH
jgi:hypothetical protein